MTVTIIDRKEDRKEGYITYLVEFDNGTVGRVRTRRGVALYGVAIDRGGAYTWLMNRAELKKAQDIIRRSRNDR